MCDRTTIQVHKQIRKNADKDTQDLITKFIQPIAPTALILEWLQWIYIIQAQAYRYRLQLMF
jgi:hypothetical protein